MRILVTNDDGIDSVGLHRLTAAMCALDGDHEVNRSGSRFFGGVSLRMNRPRPPDEKPEPPIS